MHEPVSVETPLSCYITGSCNSLLPYFTELKHRFRHNCALGGEDSDSSFIGHMNVRDPLHYSIMNPGACLQKQIFYECLL